jgi:hypothetical protein
MSSTPVCIYCKKQNVPFDREHVIPEAFGTFENNFVLHDAVCLGCNKYFGDKLDLILSRDSGEGLLRLRYDVKPLSEAKGLRNTRVRVKVNVAGPWYGAQIILKSDPTGAKLESELLPQVGFRNQGASGSDFVWFLEKELVQDAKFDEYRTGAEIKMVGPSKDSVNSLMRKLAELQIPFKEKGSIEPPITDNGQVEAVALYQIDQVILRAVAKIAFNYMAFTQGAKFALRSDFDDFRNYVRFAKEPDWKPAVIPTSGTILYDDSFSWRQTIGHLITFGWNRNNRGLLVQVSLFNSITYHVLLCPSFSLIWFPLSSGHHFDVDSRTISKLGSASAITFRSVGIK